MTTAKPVQQTTQTFQCISCNLRVEVRADAIPEVPWHCMSPMLAVRSK